MFDELNIIDVIIILAVFALVFGAWMVAMLALHIRQGARKRELEQRLGLGEEPEEGSRMLRLWRDGQEATTLAPRRRRTPLADRLERLRQSCGWDVPLQTIVLTIGGIVTASFVVTLLAGGQIVIAAAIAAGVAMCVWMYVKHRINKQVALFEQQFVDAMGLATRSLRAGHPVLGTFAVISEEIRPPVGALFGEVCQAQAMGAPLEDALRRAADGTHNSDMEMFATAVILQLRSGGSLADMIDRLAAVIRHRIRLKWRIRILTAQTQLSKRILLAFPLLMFVLLNVINPDYMTPLYNTGIGKVLIGIGAGGMLLGTWMMNRIAQLKF